MQQQVRGSFSKQFRDDAVRQVTDGGKKIVEVSRQEGISVGLVGRWIRESAQNGEDRFVAKGHQSELEKGNRRLRHNNARLQEERTILL